MKHVKHNKIAIDVKFLEQSVAFEHLIKIIDLTILFIYLLIILNSIENPSQARSIILPLFTAVFIFLNHFIPLHFCLGWCGFDLAHFPLVFDNTYCEAVAKGNTIICEW